MENLSTFVRTLGNQFIKGRKVFVDAIKIEGTLIDGTSTVGTSGQVLSTTATGVQWITVGSSDVGELNDLTDVIISTASTEQLLRFDGESWVNWTHDFLTTSATLSNLSDVGNAEANDGDILVYNEESGLWVPDEFPEFTESDTLDSVTGRGATTTNNISVGNVTSTKIVAPIIEYNGKLVIKSTHQMDIGETDFTFLGFNFGSTDVVTIDDQGYVTGAGFKTSGTTGFLRSDGSVDTNTYLTSYTESQSLDDVTTLGGSTTNSIIVGGVQAPTHSSSSAMDITADTGSNIQPGQGETDKLISFNWGATEVGYIDTDSKITFSAFKTPAGTSSGFLKADGSIDTTTYLSGLPQRDLTSLSDVTIDNPAGGDFLVYDASSSGWINSTISLAETDTLDDVTGRGNTTANSIDVGGVTTDYVQFDTAVTLTGDEGQGYMAWNADVDTVSVYPYDSQWFNIGQDMHWHVKNGTDEVIARGTVVMATGTVGNSSKIEVGLMVSDGTVNSKYIIGVALRDIAVGEFGKVVTQGTIRGIDTQLFQEGDVLWCDPLNPGDLTNVEPSAPNLRLPIAFVVSSAQNGSIAVRITQGNVLHELHDVNAASPSDGDLLAYNSTDGIWENFTPDYAASGHNHDDRYYTETESDGRYARGVTINYSSVDNDPEEDAWYKLFQITDSGSSPVICFLRGYAHSSVTFIVSEGYLGGNAHVQILDYLTSTNNNYKWIKGVRIISNGDVEVLLNGGPTVSLEMSIIGDAVYLNQPRLSTALAADVRDSVTGLTNGMIRAKGDVTGANLNISNWNTAYGWGDHAAAGYLTSYTETDPIYTASSWYTTTNNATNWETAYGWGNHAGLYAEIDHTHEIGDVTGLQVELDKKLEDESDTLDSVTGRGATTTNDIVVGSLNIADGGLITWVRTYAVSNTVILPLLNTAGNNILTGGAYRVTAHIDGTGTDQSSKAVFWNQNGAWYVNETSRSGSSSNHIQFLVDNGVPSVKTWHGNLYSVRVLHEWINLYEGTGTDNTKDFWGTDSYMSNIVGKVTFNNGGDVIIPAGNVGIGTTSPAGKLTIKDSAFTTAYDSIKGLFFDNSSITAGGENFGAGIEFGKLGSGGDLYKKAAIIPVQSDSDSDQMGISFFVANTVTQSSPVVEAMRVDYGGNVGIGTTSPAYKLDVAGDARFYDSSVAGSGILIDTGAANLVKLRAGYPGDWAATSIQIQSSTISGLDTGIYLESGGNVGIGTTSPSYKLDVDATSIRPTANLLLGEAAYSVSGSYVGLKTTFMSGSNDYMILSGKSDGSTYVSAKDGESVYIRGGGNLSSNQIVVPDGNYINIDTTTLNVSGSVSVGSNIVVQNGAGIYSIRSTINTSASGTAFRIANTNNVQAARATFVAETGTYKVAKIYEVVKAGDADPVAFKVVDTGPSNEDDFSVSFSNDGGDLLCTVTNDSANESLTLVTTIFVGGSNTSQTVSNS